MDKASKLAYQKEVEKYLEEKQVYNIFESCIKELILKKPEKPNEFLIKHLSHDKKRIFIVGPPGSHVRELSLQLSDLYSISCISVGDLLKKEISKKSEIGQQVENSLKRFKYVDDQIVTNIVNKQITEYENENKSYILEGYPKTQKQGLNLQRMGIIPQTFLILNMSQQNIYTGLKKKLLDSLDEYTEVNEDNMENKLNIHLQEYLLNIQKVKNIYNQQFFQVDGDIVNSQETLEDMAGLLKSNIQSKSLKRSMSILILGPPMSGRSTIGMKLCKQYNFVYVSTKQLLFDQIQKQTEIGKAIKSLIQAGELVPDEILNKLITARVSQIDCKMQGYVLDGYPKNLVQLVSLEDLKIEPTLVIILEASDELIFERLQHKKYDPQTGISYNKESSVEIDQQVFQRLESNAGDNRVNIEIRIKRWKELIKSVEQSYSHIILKMPAISNSQNTIEKICFQLENSNGQISVE